MFMDDSRYFYFLCGLFLAARIAFAAWWGTYNYAEDYIIAQNLANGDGYSLWGRPTALKAPIYPFLLYGFVEIFGRNSAIAIVVFQELLASTVPILISILGSLFGMRRLGKIAALCFLVYPTYFYYPVVIEITNIFVPASILWSILLLLYAKSPTPLTAALLALVSAALVLIQPVATPVVGVTICYVTFIYCRRHMVLIAAIGMVVLAPWIIRNYSQFSQIIIKSPTFMNVYAGFFPFEWCENKSTDVTNDGFMSRFYVVDERLAADVFALRQVKNDVEMEPVYRSAVIATLRSHPSVYVTKSVYQMALYFWVPPAYLGDNSLGFWIVRKGPVLMLNVLSVIGVCLLYRRHRAVAMVILGILLYFTLVYGLTQVHSVRYKLDIEWLQFFLVAACVEKLLFALRSHDHSKTLRQDQRLLDAATRAAIFAKTAADGFPIPLPSNKP
jgi:hypothetical protein